MVIFSRINWRDVDKIDSNNRKYLVTIPKSSILTIDRIYIRKGQSDYSSISFFIIFPKDFKLINPYKKKVRFWVKLEDANNIEFKEVI